MKNPDLLTPEEVDALMNEINALSDKEPDPESEEGLLLMAKIEKMLAHERAERGSCSICKFYRPDPEAGRSYFGEPNEYSGWCDNPVNVVESAGPLTMLCGDVCGNIVRKE